MKILFMGTPAAAVPSLARIIADGHEVVAVYTQPDRPSGRGNRIAMPPVKEFALGLGLTVVQPLKIRLVETLDTFRSYGADLAVVVAYGRILPQAFLDACLRGAINVHFSLLPKYRGAAPVNWAIANGEMETGVTTMQMDAGLDTGAILMQRATPIGESENAVELMERLSGLGAELLAATLADLESIIPVEQDHFQATLAPIMRKEDGVIDWSWDSKRITDRVRAFQPFPTSYTHLDGQKVTLWRTATVDDRPHRPGTILTAKSDELLVACGSGTTLAIRELQIEGKRRMATRDFLNGVKIQPGMCFG